MDRTKLSRRRRELIDAIREIRTGKADPWPLDVYRGLLRSTTRDLRRISR